VLVGVSRDDTAADCDKIAQRILNLRLWPNEEGSQWKKSVMDIDGQVLCVSQFTLLANVKKGAKPDFHAAAKGEEARRLYRTVLEKVAAGLASGLVGDGEFGAMMDVALVNDGPVTIEIDTRNWNASASASGRGTPVPNGNIRQNISMH
jgi:D-tyrosyl-tRNA(Tyr) deacylase